MNPATLAGFALVLAGAVFFLAGTVGLLRFPDLLTRLHALAKADNLGLGLICSGLALISGSAVVALKLVLVWLLAIFATASCSQLIARSYVLNELPSGRDLLDE